MEKLKLRNDEFSKTLWEYVCRYAFSGDAERGRRLAHLAEGYQRGVSMDEVIERIEKGELER